MEYVLQPLGIAIYQDFSLINAWRRTWHCRTSQRGVGGQLAIIGRCNLSRPQSVIILSNSYHNQPPRWQVLITVNVFWCSAIPRKIKVKKDFLVAVSSGTGVSPCPFQCLRANVMVSRWPEGVTIPNSGCHDPSFPLNEPPAPPTLHFLCIQVFPLCS